MTSAPTAAMLALLDEAETELAAATARGDARMTFEWGRAVRFAKLTIEATTMPPAPTFVKSL